MKHLVAAAAAAFALVAGSAALAQNAPRTYENGPVVETSYVETKPGMFNDYLQYISTTWKAEQEAAKKDGDVLEYHVLAVDHPRAGEADLVLVVIYKDMAVFDRSQAFLDARAAKLEGSVAASNQHFMERSAIRTLRGSVLTRELMLK
jgi:hypothetical protein